MSLQFFYGGTFDPVHRGHLAVARAARDQLQAPVRLMPASDPPHRPAPGATASQRLRMLELAIGEESGLLVDRRELDRQGPSYTVETLRALRQGLGDSAPVALLLGADSFSSLPQWHQWEALLPLAHFVVAERAGSPVQGELPPELAAALEGRWTDEPAALHACPAGLVMRLQHPLQPESASEIRRLVAAGGPWRHLVPPPVADFIEAQGLYTAAG